ncbi:MAG: polymorphic toxin-type HINT domain-containing protein, partial [Planctomycetaceae bacterium]
LSRPDTCDPTQTPARPRRVINLFETHPIEVYYLTVATPDGRRETLGTTGNHPFFEATARRFVPARELRPGSRLVTVTGDAAEVEAVELHTAPAGESFTTYNIEVEEDHTYHVGELGTWVHNESTERCLELPERRRTAVRKRSRNCGKSSPKSPISGGVSTASYRRLSMAICYGGLMVLAPKKNF